MLIAIPTCPEVGFASRRALKAAALTISLLGKPSPRCLMGRKGLPADCIEIPGVGLGVWPTTCERPLLLAEAAKLVRSGGVTDLLIVRLDTSLDPPIYVTFDALFLRYWELQTVTDLRPCLHEGDPRLWLMRPGCDAPELYLGTRGLCACPAAALLEQAERDAGLRRAAEYFRTNLWGGL